MFRTTQRIALIILSLVLFTPGLNASTEEYPGIMFILDGSGSMWGPAGGQTKIEAARDVMHQVVPSLPQELTVGLTSYGHRRKGDCSDVEVLIPVSGSERDGLLMHVDAISPKGKTPIADSIKLVAETLKSREQETTIVLVSDGEETCNDDPCGVVKALKQNGIKFKLHVVGFDVNATQKEQLECLASAGGGKYYGASDASTLLAAFETVTETVEKKVEEIKIEKAKATKKKAITKLGKLHIVFPESGMRSLSYIELKRKSDSKVIKSIKKPKADSMHPLLADEYDVALWFANANYAPSTEVPLGTVTIVGGETLEFKLGAVTFNIADEITKLPTEAVSVIHAESGNPLVTIHSHGNGYFLYTAKPVPAGTYDIAFHYGRSPEPTIVAENIVVAEGAEGVVSLDSGIRLKKPEGQDITGWDVVRPDDEKSILQVRRGRDNQFPLWHNFVVPAGSYNVNIHLRGMDDPLPVGEGVEIAAGDLLEFDTGL